MSSTYSGSDNYVASITIPDDGDPAVAASVNTPFESLADNAFWSRWQMLRPKLVALGSHPFTSTSARFGINYNFMSLDTSIAAGDDVRVTLVGLPMNDTIASIDVFFVPKTTARVGWPLGTAPKVALARYAIAAGGTPAVPTSLGSATYVPVSQADYQDGNFKVMTVSPAHTVNSEDYVYQLHVTDEAGANAIPGGAYVAYRVNYS
jgi:hypothetical protein